MIFALTEDKLRRCAIDWPDGVAMSVEVFQRRPGYGGVDRRIRFGFFDSDLREDCQGRFGCFCSEWAKRRGVTVPKVLSISTSSQVALMFENEDCAILWYMDFMGREVELPSL